MHRESHSTLVTNALQHVHHTQALLAYAATDADFAESLAHFVQQQYWQPLSLPIEAPSTYTIPTNQPAAVRIAHWLMQELVEQPEAYAARGTLAIWANSYQEPKNLVLGIVGLAIIGPTLGLIKKKKRGKVSFS